MSSVMKSNPGFENRFLAALPREEYAHLAPYLETVRLQQNKALYEADGNIRYAYFLKGGMASLISVTEDGDGIEVGMIGNEGVIGIPAIFGIKVSPYRVVIQLPANAMRIQAWVLRAEFNRSVQFRDLVLRREHMLLTQISQSAACNRYHSMRERLCRWLLISYDRVHADHLDLTQEFLAQMIGAPRTRVTVVANLLQKSGLIRYRRGKIQILDRRGLEAASCECYRVVKSQITHLIAA